MQQANSARKRLSYGHYENDIIISYIILIARISDSESGVQVSLSGRRHESQKANRLPVTHKQITKHAHICMHACTTLPINTPLELAIIEVSNVLSSAPD